MSYTGSLSVAQEAALRDIKPDALKQLDAATKVDLLLRHAEFEARKKEAFWNALQAFATAALPIAAFLGITTFFGGKR